MFTPSDPSFGFVQVINVPRSERWLICYRLQELMIPCWCRADGSLCVEVNNSIAALLVHSTLKQFLASRQELVDWLERCWQQEFP
ncbi:MAG: hypothetical protein F6K36_16240 [Symploca sp. SIO3C6]|uniref:Uncharacterized protein n=1 Tax=Symploca sp. SIO1C4 TaxID=2607765 RepID=A0A6B3NDC8_9CYAN|nr:hypothetical protein [Symploca sp. SIO3C6]NER29587.1 hypothetical protein [Symploca sp. SIO1C4]NET05814.1 hypothetical protein [Symploca sp. SIO2B6]NET50996.1 hypothetical protein [Merismopedia sp. SIO2A8]